MSVLFTTYTVSKVHEHSEQAESGNCPAGSLVVFQEGAGGPLESANGPLSQLGGDEVVGDGVRGNGPHRRRRIPARKPEGPVFSMMHSNQHSNQIRRMANSST